MCKGAKQHRVPFHKDLLLCGSLDFQALSVTSQSVAPQQVFCLFTVRVRDTYHEYIHSQMILALVASVDINFGMLSLKSVQSR